MSNPSNVTALHREAMAVGMEAGTFARAILRGRVAASKRAASQAAFVARVDLRCAFAGPKRRLP
jgi:hypothetical protein